MKLSEISYPQTAAQLNEHLAKTFGTKFKLENFTLEQLEDRRNRIRTKIRSIETMESYDKTNTEEYNKNKMFLDVLNAEIGERQFNESVEEGLKTHRLKEGPSMSRVPTVGKPKAQAPGKPTTTGMKMGMKPGPSTNIDIGAILDDASARIMRGMKKAGGNLQQANKEIENFKLRFMSMWNKTQKAPPRTQQVNSMYDESIVYTKGSKIREGAQEQAELVMASKELADTVGKWLQDTAEMQSESMLKLTDAIRDELGQEQADSFQNAVKPTLEALYQALEASRTALTQGVSLLTGEGAPADAMGAEAPVEGGDEMAAEPGMEPIEGGEEMGAEMGDEFAGAEAAGGGMAPEGREQRESRIPLSHQLGTILSSKKK